jgi:hypothetical protein
MAVLFLLVFMGAPLALFTIAITWTRFALKARRERRYYLALIRVFAALISFAGADYLIWIGFRIATI